MVRQATAEDWPKVLELMRACNEASCHEADFDDASVLHMFELSLKNPSFACFVTEKVDGFVYLALSASHFNFSVIYANELGFWGKGGKALVNKASKWAKDMGASRLSMASEDCIKGAAMERWYRKAGFVPTGRTHAKNLELV
ncbi:MAG: GNAT family N-acetyltransferase [Colwellia sp.]|nr:GNAT family N-acetyltransferase [Colwellia sp.]